MPYRTLSSKEYFDLLCINFKVKLRNVIEYSRVILKYYGNSAFRNTDSHLLLAYAFDNPFQISKRFMLSKGEEDIYTYGETPLSTLEYIAQQARIKSKDVVFELGCGRGRTCFWLNQFIGCRVVGIDYVPEFIVRANNVKEKHYVKGVEFRTADILETDFTGATVIYLYGICYSDAFIKKLINRLEALPSGTRIITVSYSLAEYKTDAPFEILKCFPARFTWGMADVYIQVRK
jgi:SAM-dependent methyltransferase